MWKVSFDADHDVRLGAPELLLERADEGVQVTAFHPGEGRSLGRRTMQPTRRIVLWSGALAR